MLSSTKNTRAQKDNRLVIIILYLLPNDATEPSTCIYEVNKPTLSFYHHTFELQFTRLMLSLKLGLSISVAIIDIEETSLSMVAIYPI